jgi:hypothetical protein
LEESWEKDKPSFAARAANFSLIRSLLSLLLELLSVFIIFLFDELKKLEIFRLLLY